MSDRDRQVDLARQALQRKEEEARAKAEQAKLAAHERPPDEFDPRAKSSGHGKKTADKWNQ
jgi:hypothetical protein